MATPHDTHCDGAIGSATTEGAGSSGRRTALSDARDLEGTLLDGKHRVERLGAKGGFGTVYRGHHLGLDLPTAIKVLHLLRDGPPADATELLLRFLEEARTVARLRHPNIVSVLDTGLLHNSQSPARIPWMVLAWCEGKTLEQRLERRRQQGGRAPQACLDLLRPAFVAIAHAHREGVAHRDIKPGNIMLNRGPHGPTARVPDFGVAKLVAPREEPRQRGDHHAKWISRIFTPVCRP